MRISVHPHGISIHFGGPFVHLDRRARLSHATHFLHTIKRRGKGKDLDRGGVPVEPNRPNSLTGGAAAPLEFNDK